MRTFIFLAFMLFILYSNAENFDADQKIYPMLKFSEQYNVIDTAHYEVIYAHVSIDPVLNQREITYHMLALGDNECSYYLKYGTYQKDSVSNAHHGSFQSWNELNATSKKYDSSINTGLVLKDRTKQSLIFQGIIFGQSYRYEEDIPTIDWKLEEGTREVLGYECHKATARWRGREWTAWYSDIPYSDGPWKFTGLPGLILSLEDSTGEHKFKAVGLKKDEFPFGTIKKSNPIRTNRKKYEDLLKDHKLNAAKTIADSGLIHMMPDEKSHLRNRRLFYNPIELE